MKRILSIVLLSALTAIVAITLGAPPAAADDCTMLTQVDLECQFGVPDTLQIDTQAKIGISVTSRRPTKWRMFVDGVEKDSRTTGSVNLGAGGFDCPDGGSTEQWANVYLCENSASNIPDGSHCYEVKIEVRYITMNVFHGEFSTGEEEHSKNCP